MTADDAGEFCVVCMLRSAIGNVADPGGQPGSFESSVESGFGHYEVDLNEDGSAVELGRGAMGQTYKAFDTELQCPVALKVIGERHLGDPVVLRRFLREARAAASLRHPNVASVFHLGRTGGSYFYAMEFVEGETLERLIKRSGNLGVALALDITSQITSGLAAIHKQKLIHRDIKPANIMVSLEENGAPRVKIIDLGLAKSLDDTHLESGISEPGAFAGTPEFASPEQFAAAPIDIRSDLYSLGVTLWDMVTGQVPFRGTPAEVMYQHRYKAPPIEQLKLVPQPIAVLLDVLLEKNPKYRFQTPAKLLEALETVKRAVRTGRRMIKTIRVNVLASSDVQKERNLADRLIRSIAAEFNMPVSATELNFQRLVEADLASESGELDEHWDENDRVLLCPWFTQDEMPVREIDNNNGSGASAFDLAVCIVWSRLDTRTESALAESSCVKANLERDIQHASRLDDTVSEPEGLELVVYRNCNDPIPPLEPKEARDEFGRRWDALQDFFLGWERDHPDGVERAVNAYRSLQEFEEAFRNGFRRFLATRVGDQVRQSLSRRRVRRWHTSPFRGLSLFSYEHAPIFCGRTKAIGEVLEAMEAQIRVDRPFVIVVGPSGSGKSSLVQAGVLPLLTQPGTIEGIGLWRRAVTRPGASGSSGDCFDALAAALLEPKALPPLQNPESLNGTRDLACELREHAHSVALRVRDALDHAAREWTIEHRHQLEEQERQFRASGRPEVADVVRERAERLNPPKPRLALVVDQLEELFTSGFSVEVRRDYIAAISGLARSGRVYVLATLRSDFYSAYQQFPELIELTKPSGKVDLRRPAPREIGEIIRLPAEAAGLSFEEEEESGQRLDEALRDAASATPASLPLLEHVLSLLYEEQAIRDDQILRWSDYRELGELKGALAQHAERIFATLGPAEQEAFPLVMRHLVTLRQGEEEVPNRRTVPYRDFISLEQSNDTKKTSAKGFVDQFIQARLLVADTDPRGEVTVSVAHEALLREWKRVREWLIENREFLRMRDRLDASLKLWLSRGGQEDDLLRPGLALAEGEKLAADFASSLSEQQANYVRGSIVERERLRAAQERVRYRVMAGISAALVVAVVFGIVSFRQYRRAELAKVAASQAAKRATLARNDAGKLINYMTIDLRDKLKPIGRLDLLYDVNQRVLDYYASVGSDSDSSPDILSQWSVALANSGDIQKDRGDLAGALKSYSDSLGIRERLARQNPSKDEWQQNRALGIANVGDVLYLQGDSSGALERYKTALNILQQLVARLSGNADLRDNLSMMQENIGQVLEKRGDLTDALKSYQDCLAIRKELKKQEPGSVERDHDISLVLLKIGRVYSRQGSMADAIKSYQDSLAIQQRLADAEPTNAMWQQELSSSEDQFGDGLNEQGDLVGALGMHRQSFKILQRLTERDPSNATWQRMLARSYSYLSDVFILRGNLADGLENCEHALEIRDMLAKRDPSNANAQRDLAIGYDDLGKVLELQGDESGAKEKYIVSLSISRKLAAQDPNNAEWQRDLSISLERVGTILSAQSDFAGASDKYLESLAIRKKLALRDQSNAQWQNDLSWSYISVGDLLYAKKDMGGALTNYRTAQGIERELVRRDSKTLQLQSDLAVTCQKVGDILSAQGRFPEAWDSYHECVVLCENLVGKDPTNSEWASELAFACYSVATTGYKIAREPSAEVRSLLERGRDILVKLQTQSALSPVDERHLQEIRAALGGP
jgi:serine/threonine protein kinase/tetratricopeptide (TPR) repeat protein